MLTVAVSTLRVRWVSFIGTFLALTLGVGLMAAAILVISATGGVADAAQQRYSEVPVVVVPNTTIDVPDSYGGVESTSVMQQPGLTPAMVSAVAKTGRVIPDHSFYAQLADGPKDQVGRGWSIAEAGGYHLTAGRAPASDGQLVVGGGARSLIGRTLPLTTATGPRTVTVSGVTGAVPFEHAVFFTDAEAARLSPAVDALAALGPADAVRQAAAAVSGAKLQVRVLTGKDRAIADPHHAALLSMMDNVDTPLGLAAAVAGFVAIFVVAGTFAQSIAQRRRELALLRLVGSTRRQLRSLIYFEAVLIGLLASATGCGIGVAATPLCRQWLIDHNVVTDDFVIPVVWSELLVAACIGMFTALLGVIVSSRRASRVNPGEALQEATVERKSRGADIFRWVVGGLALIAGVVTVSGTAVMQPEAGANAGASLSIMLVIVGAFATLAGVLARPVIRLLTALPSLLAGRRHPDAGGGAVWMTARQSALTAFRRTASATTPVVIIISLAGCMLGSIDTINAAQATAARQQLSRTDFVISPAGTPGLSKAVVNRVRAVPGTTAMVTTPTPIFTLLEDHTVLQLTAAAVSSAEFPTVAKLPLAAGSLSGLGPGSVVLTSQWPGSHHVGDEVPAWLGDGTPKKLRVAAVLKAGNGSAQAYLDSANAGTGMASRIDVRLAPGADRDRTAAALKAAVHGLGGKVDAPYAVWAAATDANEQGARTGILMILGLSVLFALAALANTLVMTVSDRKRELAVLRLVGATKGQVLRGVAVETLMSVAAGAVISALASAVGIAGSWSALRHLVGSTPAVVPWSTLGELLAACGVVALVAVLVPSALALRGGDGRSILAGISGEAG
jgi:putative ABC transport system permease protein